MLVEREHDDLDGALPLLGLSKLSNVHRWHTISSGKQGRNALAVLPDRGLMLLPFISSYLLAPKTGSRKPKWLEETNKEVFFNIHTRSVAVTYCGPAIDQGKKCLAE